MNDKAAGASPGLSEELGPLPEPEWWLNKPHGTQYYTADQKIAQGCAT